jgi:hypothetical protein
MVSVMYVMYVDEDELVSEIENIDIHLCVSKRSILTLI